MTDHGPNRRGFTKGASPAAGGAAMGAYPEDLFAAPRRALPALRPKGVLFQNSADAMIQRLYHL